jgi:hypothetical protein
MAETNGKDVEIRHDFADVETAFANHFTVQLSAHGEVLLSFFEIVPPLILGDAEERQRKIEAVKEVTARCVARIALSGERFQEVAATMASRAKLEEEEKKREREKK